MSRDGLQVRIRNPQCVQTTFLENFTRKNLISSEVYDFLSEFKPNSHVVMFYDTIENKREILFSHLKFGAENNEGLAYVCSEEKPKGILEQMNHFGIDTEDLRARNRLTVNNYNRIYIVEGRVSIPNIIGAFSDLSTKYKTMGLAGLRASAEMSCFFREGKVKELIDYENALHRRFAFPAEGICAYNVHELMKSGDLGMIMDLVRAHDPVILFGPKESLILRPEDVEKRNFEDAMKVRIG
jgi:hypothetical protein